MTIQMFRKRIVLSFFITLAVLLLSGFLFTPPLFAADTATQAVAVEPSSGGDLMWVVIAASIAFSFGALAAGYAISHVGAAAMGAMSEKPEIGSQALIFIALAEGLVVFGFITALMILGKA